MFVSYERRKYPRYSCYLPAFLEDQEVQVFMCDLSLNGCFVEAPERALLPVGRKVHMVLYLPCVGQVPVEGLVVHNGSPKRRGMGIEFIRFPNRLHLVYAKFVKVLPILEEAREMLQQLTAKNRKESKDAHATKFGG